MANLRISNFRLGRDEPRQRSVAQATCHIDWTPIERQLNEEYVLRVYLVEWDEVRDIFRVEPNGALVRDRVCSNPDEWWQIHQRFVRPSQGTEFRVESSGQFAEQERGPGEWYLRGTLAPRNIARVASFTTPDIVLELDP